MSFFTSLIRKLRPGLYRQGSLSQTDVRYEQEARERLAALRDLEQTMDPLIAARVYNAKNTIVGRLPEELLLRIVDLIGEDAVALYCLRRASRTFRRLVYEPSIWKRTKSGPRVPPDGREWSFNLSNEEYGMLRQRLQTDGMCSDCKLWCSVPVDGPSRQRAQAANLSSRRQNGFTCKFRGPWLPLLHCHPCGTHQDPLQFSLSEQDFGRQDRTCLGRQGAVKLCDHVQLSWAEIEHYFAEWLRHSPGDWDALFRGFNLECRDPSHDSRCVDEEVPTWPRARIEADRCNDNKVMLILEWKPHSGFDALALTREGQAPAPELRRVFQGYRRGAGKILYPSIPSIPLPEMACYGVDKCRCVCYETGDNVASNAGARTNDCESPKGKDSSKHANFFGEDDQFRIYAVHETRRRSSDTIHEIVYTTKHWPTDTRSSVCLVTTYQRRIRLFSKGHLLAKLSPSAEAEPTIKVEPSHAWFHAMDPDTYDRPSASLQLPLCKKERCMNYYRRPKVTKCGNSWRGIHYPCDCS